MNRLLGQALKPRKREYVPRVIESKRDTRVYEYKYMCDPIVYHVVSAVGTSPRTEKDVNTYQESFFLTKRYVYISYIPTQI